MFAIARLTPVLLCGGHGTRLWPLSRKSYPKQFLPLIDTESPFQACARRLTGPLFDSPVIITSHDFRFIAAEQCEAVGLRSQSILIEPENRNTGPAVLAAALWLADQDPEAMMLVSPCDHMIPDAAAFRAAVEAAVPAAQDGQIVTFGVVPTRPEPGYGYLELAEGVDLPAGPVQKVSRFVEKPDMAKAEVMLQQGGFLWNAGIFLFSVRTIIAAFEIHAPELTEQVRAAVAAKTEDLDFTRLAAAPWEEISPISIDYAIMERDENLGVMPYTGLWSDLGSWGAVWKEGDADARGNVCSAHATAIDCTDTLLRSDHETLELVGIGLSDIIAVALPDAVLVAHRSEDQRVGEVVKALQTRDVPQAVAFPLEHRPWGTFERLAAGNRFQVKRIRVTPGATLSLQSHHHRSEHWVVVQGTARVTVGEEITLLTENQSIYVPLGVTHRLENPGKVELILIEVQTGTYLGEDDIIRYEDIYARK